MREFVKKSLLDTSVEPYVRWLVKRSRGIPIPFDLVKNEIYDRQAAELIRRVLRDTSNTIDIGCHGGYFLKLFLQYAPHGQHLAFEPIPDLANALKNNFPSAVTHNLALSDTRGEATFYVIPDAPELSGLKTRDFLARDKAREELTIRTERLDDLIPRDTKIDLIKIDVEGAEGLVIKGGLDTIRRNQPYIILEHGSLSSQDFGVSSHEIYDLLVEQCGLRVSLLKHWLYGKAPLSRKAFAEGADWYFLAHPADA